jgi:hypothetical protein
MMQRDRKREGLRECRAAWLVVVNVREYREIEAGDRTPSLDTYNGSPSCTGGRRGGAEAVHIALGMAHDSPRRLAMNRGVAAFVCGLALAACTSQTTDHFPTPAVPEGAVARLEIVGVPEGAPPAIFERHVSADGPWQQKLLSLVRKYLPRLFPRPLDQPDDCSIGGDLVATFADGTKLSYGPCVRPDSINRLWAAMMYAIHPPCAPACGPNGEPPPQIEGNGG